MPTPRERERVTQFFASVQRRAVTRGSRCRAPLKRVHADAFRVIDVAAVIFAPRRFFFFFRCLFSALPRQHFFEASSAERHDASPTIQPLQPLQPFEPPQMLIFYFRRQPAERCASDDLHPR